MRDPTARERARAHCDRRSPPVYVVALGDVPPSYLLLEQGELDNAPPLAIVAAIAPSWS